MNIKFIINKRAATSLINMLLDILDAFLRNQFAVMEQFYCARIFSVTQKSAVSTSGNISFYAPAIMTDDVVSHYKFSQVVAARVSISRFI